MSGSLIARRPPQRIGQFLERGVWKAPWMGPQGEMVLLAVAGSHRLVGEPKLLPRGCDFIAAHDQMWDLLDEGDPSAFEGPPPEPAGLNAVRRRCRSGKLALVK